MAAHRLINHLINRFINHAIRFFLRLFELLCNLWVKTNRSFLGQVRLFDDGSIE